MAPRHSESASLSLLAAGSGERLARLCHELLKARQVELFGLDVQHVAAASA